MGLRWDGLWAKSETVSATSFGRRQIDKQDESPDSHRHRFP